MIGAFNLFPDPFDGAATDPFSSNSYEEAVTLFQETLRLSRGVQGSPAAWASTHLNLGHAFRKLQSVLAESPPSRRALTLAPLQTTVRGTCLLPTSDSTRPKMRCRLQRPRPDRASAGAVSRVYRSLSRGASTPRSLAALQLTSRITTGPQHCARRPRHLRSAQAGARRRRDSHLFSNLALPGLATVHLTQH